MTTSKRNVDERPHYVSFVAGVAGGSASTALLFPLDTIKVRMQVNEDKLRLATRTSVISAMRGVVRHEGFLGLYQGLAPALVASALSWGGYFYIYEGTKRRISGIDGVGEKETLTGMENFAAACLSGAAMVCVTNPIWLIKTRMQLQLRNFQDPLHVGGKVVRPYSGMLDAALTISRDEGPFAMYKGASVAMVMVSHGGIQFMCYEYLKQHFSKYLKLEREKKDLLGHERIGVLEKLEDSFGYLLMGAGSKIIASTFTYPLQVIKSRLQQRSEAVNINQDGRVTIRKRSYKGPIDCVRRIWYNEGILGFWKGCIPNAVRVAPSAAITFVTYEFVLSELS